MKTSYAVAAAASLAYSAFAQSISDSCSTFLADFDKDDTIKSCTADLLQATSAFDPTSGSGGSSADLDSVTDALSSVCDDTQFCSYVTIKDYLSQLQGNCSDELKQGDTNVPAVSMLYDALYISVPFHNAICATDGDSGSCLAKIANSIDSTDTSDATKDASVKMNAVGNIGAANATTQSFASTSYGFTNFVSMAKQPSSLFVQAGDLLGKAAKRLRRRQSEDDEDASSSAAQASGSAAASGKSKHSSKAEETKTADATEARTSDISTVADDTSSELLGDIAMPNGTTFTSTNLPFLFMSSSMSSDVLCSDCTKTIMAQYIAFQMKIPFAQGLGNSLLLSGQSQLYKGIGAKCGDGFITDIQNQAGSVSLDSGAFPVGGLPSTVAVVLGALAMGLLL